MGEFFSFVIFDFQVLDTEQLLFYNWGEGSEVESGQGISTIIFKTKIQLGHCSQ